MPCARGNGLQSVFQERSSFVSLPEVCAGVWGVECGVWGVSARGEQCERLRVSVYIILRARECER